MSDHLAPCAASELDADPSSLLELAASAARSAGQLLRERYEAGGERSVASKSSPTDLVSEADLASERAIRSLLARERPGDGFLGEESGDGSEGSSGLRWVVDPLDGTINFLFGIPQWCVSVAVEDAAGALAGAVYDPNRDELFSATRGGEPRCNGELIRARAPTDLAGAMVATGFAYDADVREAQAEVLGRLVARVRDIRRFGSAALDLVWTAAGRYDAYYERTVKPWDIAAGVLVCRRAGLQVVDLPARERLPYGILAARPPLVAPLMEIVG